jgi:hypothetical protein
MLQMWRKGIFQNALTLSINQEESSLPKYNRNTFKVLEVEPKAMVAVALVLLQYTKNLNLPSIVPPLKSVQTYMASPAIASKRP